MSTGIDYGNGMTNIDFSTSIRYGVINQREVLQAWCDSSEAYYGDPTCPKCGNDALDTSKNFSGSNEAETADYKIERGCCGDYVCHECEYFFDADEAFGEEPLSHFFDDDGIKAECGESGDIFITLSPYYTYAPFCSPCAPGACHLGNAGENEYTHRTGEKTYCFDHEWFDDGKAPYRVFRVADNEEVFPKK